MDNAQKNLQCLCRQLLAQAEACQERVGMRLVKCSSVCNENSIGGCQQSFRSSCLGEGGATAEAKALLVSPQGDGPRGNELHSTRQDDSRALRDQASSQGDCRVGSHDAASLLQDLWTVAVSASTQCDRWHGKRDCAPRDADAAPQGRLDGPRSREGGQQRRVLHCYPAHVVGEERPCEQRGVHIIEDDQQLCLQRFHALVQLCAEV
mmetsp:Transcript_62927/g.146513  ORF Transcript_62927/g.146513 Transcript_62927/m.146513 type:complete len:207 (-) Transcript_62927:1776-2396(-)